MQHTLFLEAINIVDSQIRIMQTKAIAIAVTPSLPFALEESDQVVLTVG